MSAETVMIVDDEQMVLTSLATYLELETEYRVVTFTSAEQALAHLGRHEVDLVISDFLMPGMDGIAFLSRARELVPDVPRIVLTGYADKENAIKAINQVGLFHYIEKPWNNDELLHIIQNGLEKRRLLRKLSEKIDEIAQAQADLQGLRQEILKAFS
jgi:DNA-binding NtrC family response regulator